MPMHVSLSYSHYAELLMADTGREEHVHIVPLGEDVSLYCLQSDPGDVSGFQVRNFVASYPAIRIQLQEVFGEEVVRLVDQVHQEASAMPAIPVPLTEEFLRRDESWTYSKLEAEVPELPASSKIKVMQLLRQAGWIV